MVNNMENKKGINLVALSIAIIVLSILATMITINMQNSVDNAKLVAFTEELRSILDATNVYYLENGTYPISESYTEEEFLSLAEGDNIQGLQEEMTLNKEDSTSFFKVNLSLIKASGGLFSDLGEQYNVYVINEDATNIYYPTGYIVGGESYYSLNSKITDIEKVSSSNSSGQMILNNTTESIKITKDTEEWTNSLKLTITTTLASEQLFYTIGNVETEITASLPYTLELSVNTLTSEQLTGMVNNKVMYFSKKANGNVTAKTIIDISNLDITAPSLNSEPVVTINDDYNIVKLLDQAEDESGVVASYYISDGSNLTAEEIVSTGIKADSTFIKLDTSITSIKMVLVDGAGNISDVIDVIISE